MKEMPVAIPFYSPFYSPQSMAYVQQLCNRPSLWEKRPFTRACTEWFQHYFPHARIWFTSSCTRALEAAAFLLKLKPQDEVIVPSFTHPATANAFAVHQARLVFVDVVPDTMTMDVRQVSSAITPRTRAIVAMHYGGMAPDMKTLVALAEEHKLVLIEDNAHGLGAQFDHRPLGGWGHMSAYSFERQKNISCGEGGALLIHDKALWPSMAQYAESGTNRSDFYAGKVPHYEWVTTGSKIAPSEIAMAYLYGVLQETDPITHKRRTIWNAYCTALTPIEQKGLVHLPHPHPLQQHNAHIFFLRLKNARQRKKLIEHLAKAHIAAHFHYSPLHTSPMGRQMGRFHGRDRHTEPNSQSLLRLPMHTALTSEQIQTVTESVIQFFTANAH